MTLQDLLYKRLNDQVAALTENEIEIGASLTQDLAMLLTSGTTAYLFDISIVPDTEQGVGLEYRSRFKHTLLMAIQQATATHSRVLASRIAGKRTRRSSDPYTVTVTLPHGSEVSFSLSDWKRLDSSPSDPIGAQATTGTNQRAQTPASIRASGRGVL